MVYKHQQDFQETQSIFDDLNHKHPNKISNQETITYEQYSECPDNTQVVFYAHNGKHTWPGGVTDFFKNITGRSINATNVIWDFFAN